MITLPAAALRTALDTVMPACERNATLPILQHLHAAVRGHHLALTATDLERQITAIVPLDIGSGPGLGDDENPDGTTFPGHKLHGIAKALPGDATISLSQGDNGQVTLRAGRSRYRLGTLPGADYPRMDRLEPAGTSDHYSAAERIALAPRLLAEALRHVIPAMARNDARYYLNGLYLARDGEQLDLVATDGHRLHHRRINPSDGWHMGSAALAQPVIIPGESAIILAKLIDPKDTEDEVILYTGERAAEVRYRDITLITKLTDARYPDWPSVVPRDLSHRLTLPRAALLGALQEVAVLSDDAQKGVRCTFTADAVTLEAVNAEQESANTSVAANQPCPTLPSSDGAQPAPSIGFNLRYLTDALTAAGTDAVRMELTDSDTSAIISPIVDSGDNELTLVVMPMRI
jgi:DNA polymerase-3 subunit beta